MKIIKYQKQGSDKYKIYFSDNTTIILYEDVILKNELLIKKNIEDNQLNKIKEDNEFYKLYTTALRYIGLKIRSISELTKYLEKKNVDPVQIKIVIEKLIKGGYLNDEKFVQSFINDKINLTNFGPYKIIKYLKDYDIDQETINKYMDNIPSNIFNEKIGKIIEKFLKQNKSYSGYVLKQKIFQNLINLGYEKEIINKNINKYEFNGKDPLKEYQKLVIKYAKKYDKDKLSYVIKQKLLLKGYSIEEINKIEVDNE